MKPANRKEKRRDRRRAENQSGKRKCVVVIRQRDGLNLPAAFASEAAAISFIKARVAAETEIHADEAPGCDALHARYAVKRISHQVAYSEDGTHTNGAENFFSRMRRGEVGHHHHIAGVYFARYTQEAGWREDRRRNPDGAQVRRVVGLALAAPPSVDFCGYWQRAARARPASRRSRRNQFGRIGPQPVSFAWHRVTTPAGARLSAGPARPGKGVMCMSRGRKIGRNAKTARFTSVKAATARKSTATVETITRRPKKGK